MPIHVLLAVDSNQVLGCAVSMRSIVENAAPAARLHFHLMTHDVPMRDRAALRATVESSGREARIDLHEVDVTRFGHLMRSKLVSHTAYARLLIEDVLTVDVERCLYVDCDMVVERDVAGAWEFPLGGRTAAAVPNGSASDTRDNQARLGLAAPRYFNSGFMLIDVRRWRERRVSARALAHAEDKADRLVLHDQDALNCALEGDWAELPREWNAGLSVSGWLSPGTSAVYHFWGAPKPWHADYEGRFQELFLRYLDLTPYAGRRPWNPAGLGALFARTRRRVPYLPAVLRAVRGLVGGKDSRAAPRRPG